MKSDFLTNLFFRALQTVSIATMIVQLLLPVAIVAAIYLLWRIARNLALNRYKARAAEKRGGGEAALSLEELAECLPSGSEPQDEAEAAAFSHLLSEFLRTESEEARRVFLQRYFMCCPVAQVADHFGFSESRVKSMLLRTRTRLAKYLESEGWTK